MQLLCLAVTLALLGKVSSQNSQSPLSGKCKADDSLKPIALDANLLPGRWKILYLSNTDDISELDHAYNVIAPAGGNTYKLVGTKVLKNNRSFTRHYTMRIDDNNVMLVEIVHDGIVSQYKAYPLAKSSEDAILFYHCSDTGVFPLDVRFIAIPDGRSLSDESFQQLLKVDETHSFIGNLYKLPNDLK